MNTKKQVAATKQFRKDLDGVLQKIRESTGDFIPYEGLANAFESEDIRVSRERKLAITKIQEAIMWLGMDLKDMNEPNPYPESYDPSSPTIVPTADGLKL